MGIQRSIALKSAALLTASLMLTGCVNSTVREWALIGAATGAAAGGGVGYLISDKDLLGSSPTPEGGDVSLERGTTIAVGLAMGAVLGLVVGSMIGHHRYDPVQEAWEAQQERNAGGVQVNVDLGGSGGTTGMSAEDLGMDPDDMAAMEEDVGDDSDDDEDQDEEESTDDSDDEVDDSGDEDEESLDDDL